MATGRHHRSRRNQQLAALAAALAGAAAAAEAPQAPGAAPGAVYSEDRAPTHAPGTPRPPEAAQSPAAVHDG